MKLRLLLAALALAVLPARAEFTIAPQTAEARSARVEVMTRQVNVEALKPCSAPTTK